MTLYIKFMFIINNIKAKTSDQKLFSTGRRKYIKFELKGSIKKHPFPARVMNPYQIAWDKELTFSQHQYNQILPLQIYSWHQFGYDKEEFENHFQGKIKIEKTMQTFITELRSPVSQKVIGYLSGSITHKKQSLQKLIQKKIAITQWYHISSIVARIPLAVDKKIFAKIQISNQTLKTSTVKTFCGDLVFTDHLSCLKTDLETKGQLSVWQILENEEIQLGKGFLELVGPKPPKRVTLLNLQKEVIGEAYIDSMQEEKQQKQKLKKKSSSLPNYQKMSPKKMMEQTSTSRISSVTNKRLSVVSPNQSIMFGTEQRFKQGGTDDKTVYRNTRMSQLRANRIFNKSQLSTILENQTPGVGEYVLPSIWDKY